MDVIGAVDAVAVDDDVVYDMLLKTMEDNGALQEHVSEEREEKTRDPDRVI